MDICKINFNQQENDLAYGIYQDLRAAGVSCANLDSGYSVTNYSGIHCQEKDAKSCVKGAGDEIIEASEVLEYALGHYEQYRTIIEGRLGEPLPWVLDDLDSKTVFDEEIRKKVQGAINELKRIIKEQGINEGSERYKEMLAAGLCWFVAIPNVKEIPKLRSSHSWRRVEMGLRKDGLKDFEKYLKTNGGLRVEGDYSNEYTALEALKHNNGECTEISKILFGVLKIAGLQPIFLNEDIFKEQTKDPVVKSVISSLPFQSAFIHLCIGYYTDGRLRILDPMFLNSNADYRYFYPLSLRRYLGLDYGNIGNALKAIGKFGAATSAYFRAIKIDPWSAEIYYDHGNLWKDANEIEKSITAYSKAIEINPRFTAAYNNRGDAWSKKGELNKAISDFRKVVELDPKLMVAYFNCGNAWLAKGDLNQAIANYTEAIKIEPMIAEAYYARGIAWSRKMKLENSITDYTKAILIKPNYTEAYYNRGIALKAKGELNAAMADFTKSVELDPNDVAGYAHRGLIRIMTNDIDGAIKDLSVCFKLANLPFTSVFSSVSRDLKIFWNDRINKNIAESFKRETGEDIASFQALTILSYALYESGDRKGAIERFKIIDDIEFKTKPSNSTKKFLKKLLAAMPADMKQDKTTQEIVKTIKEKLK